MAVGAHPDDLEWYAGGTAAKLTRAGAQVVLVVCTDGAKGTYDPQTDGRELAARREAEQRRAASLLGLKDVIFLGYPDGELEPTAELRRRLAELYRQYRPDLLLAFDPWKDYELHPDHIAAGRAALDARIAARMPLYYPELRERGLAAWSIGEIWLFNAGAPNHWVDVTDALAWQQRALALHVSQPSVWDDAANQFIEQGAREHGERIGVKYAEAFRRIVIQGAMTLADGTRQTV